jgi:hypothetical protein
MLDTLTARLDAEVRQADRHLKSRLQDHKHRLKNADHRLDHIAYLIADLSLRYVIPKLEVLASKISHSKAPRSEGVRDVIFVAFEGTEAFPLEARVSVALRPDPFAEKLRVAFTGVMNPPQMGFERESWLYLEIDNPDIHELENFLDTHIIQFVKAYFRARDGSDDLLLLRRWQTRGRRPLDRRCRGQRSEGSGSSR